MADFNPEFRSCWISNSTFKLSKTAKLTKRNKLCGLNRRPEIEPIKTAVNDRVRLVTANLTNKSRAELKTPHFGAENLAGVQALRNSRIGKLGRGLYSGPIRSGRSLRLSGKIYCAPVNISTGCCPVARHWPEILKRWIRPFPAIMDAKMQKRPQGNESPGQSGVRPRVRVIFYDFLVLVQAVGQNTWTYFRAIW